MPRRSQEIEQRLKKFPAGRGLRSARSPTRRCPDKIRAGFVPKVNHVLTGRVGGTFWRSAPLIRARRPALDFAGGLAEGRTTFDESAPWMPDTMQRRPSPTVPVSWGELIDKITI